MWSQLVAFAGVVRPAPPVVNVAVPCVPATAMWLTSPGSPRRLPASNRSPSGFVNRLALGIAGTLPTNSAPRKSVDGAENSTTVPRAPGTRRTS